MTRRRPANARVLIVDDQKHIHDDFEEMLLPRRAAADDLAAWFLSSEAPDYHLPEFELLHAMGGKEACELVARATRAERPIAVAFIDIRMPPGLDGVAAAREIRRVDRDIEIVLMTAYADTSLADVVRDVEPVHKLLYVRKPFAREEVQQITLALVEKWNRERRLEARRRQLEVAIERMKAEMLSLRTVERARPAHVLPLAEVERRAVVRALEAADHNVTRAAQALGINRATLYRKLKKYGVSSDAARHAGRGD